MKLELESQTLPQLLSLECSFSEEQTVGYQSFWEGSKVSWRYSHIPFSGVWLKAFFVVCLSTTMDAKCCTWKRLLWKVKLIHICESESGFLCKKQGVVFIAATFQQHSSSLYIYYISPIWIWLSICNLVFLCVFQLFSDVDGKWQQKQNILYTGGDDRSYYFFYYFVQLPISDGQKTEAGFLKDHEIRPFEPLLAIGFLIYIFYVRDSAESIYGKKEEAFFSLRFIHA